MGCQTSPTGRGASKAPLGSLQEPTRSLLGAAVAGPSNRISTSELRCTIFVDRRKLLMQNRAPCWHAETLGCAICKEIDNFCLKSLQCKSLFDLGRVILVDIDELGATSDYHAHIREPWGATSLRNRKCVFNNCAIYYICCSRVHRRR